MEPFELLKAQTADDKNFLQHNDSLNCSHNYAIAGHYTGSNGKKMVTWKCRNCPASYDREEM